MRRLRWFLLVLAAVVAVLGATTAATLALTFGGLESSSGHEDLPGGARLVSAGASNVYVIPAGDGVMLVDCGDQFGGEAIAAELARRGLNDSAVKTILLTHGHRDHLAACHRYPQARVYALAEERPLIEGDVVAKGPVSRWRAPARDLGVRVTDPLRDGDTLSIGDTAVAVYRVPGHTGGSAAFLINRVLFLGDAALGVESGGTHLRPAAWIFSDDREEANASLVQLARRLAGTGSVAAIAFGHSGPAQSSTPLDELAR